MSIERHLKNGQSTTLAMISSCVGQPAFTTECGSSEKPSAKGEGDIELLYMVCQSFEEKENRQSCQSLKNCAWTGF